MALTILLQIIIFAFIILGNIYQSIVTSFMMEPVLVQKFKKFEDLIKSDVKLATNANPLDRQYFKDSKSEKIISSISVNNLKNILLTCDFLDFYNEYEMKRNSKENSSYILDEKLFIEQIMLDAGILNPFIEKLQNLMDLSFEAGLPKIWNLMSKYELFNLVNSRKTLPQFASMKLPTDSLSFYEIMPIFGILSIGFLIAGFLLLLEIFHHDFWSHFKFEFYKKKFFKMINLKSKKKNLKVRKK